MISIAGNQRGGVIIQAIVFGGIFLGVAASLLVTIQRGIEGERGGRYHIIARELRERVISCLQSPEGWAATVNGNGRMQCLRDGSNCSGQAGKIQVLNAAGQPCIAGYDPLSITSGINLSGLACNGFVPMIGNSACAMKMHIAWGPLLCGTPCLDPESAIAIRFEHSGGGAQNLSVHNLIFTRTSLTGFNRFLQVKGNHSGNGGRCVPGTWNAVDLASAGRSPTESDPYGLVEIVNNQGTIRLQPGSYRCEVSATSFNVNLNEVRLVDLATSRVAAWGSTEYSHWTRGSAASRSRAVGYLRVIQPKSYRLERYCGVTKNFDRELGEDLMASAGAPAWTSENYAEISCMRFL